MTTSLLQADENDTLEAQSTLISISGQYNIAGFVDTNDGSRLVLTKTIPEQLIGRYVNAAMKTVVPSQLDDGSWFAEITVLKGVWGSGDNPHDALVELKDVLIDWLLLKIEHEDQDIPILEGINLNLVQ